MKKLIALLCLILAVTQMNGQTTPDMNFRSFSSSYKKSAEVVDGQLNFRFESLGFFQNNEYIGFFDDGYTLTGAMLRPKLSYSPAASLYVEVGAHLIKYNGREDFTTAMPWFTARYLLSDRITIITGNLDQSNQHGLTDPLWEPERIYTDKPEAGLQILYSTEKLQSQVWINWETFILRRDPFQEQFTFGATTDYRIYKNSALSLTLPLQMLVYHKGGEINTNNTGQRIQTHANFAAGWKLAINVGEKLKTINLNGSWYGYKALTEESTPYPFNEGHAYLLETSAQLGHSLLSASYWNAYQFIAPNGRCLYQSISNTVPGFSQADRSIICAKYYWQREITKGARAAFQLEGFVDLPTGDLSYYYGFYLLMNQDFLLKRFKN